jgi:Glyoxalase/Bleomycin resistance protein/Dioxygenase superfamily
MSEDAFGQVSGFAAVLGVADVGAAIRYYHAVLGFAIEFAWEDPPSYAGIRLGEACLHPAKSTRSERGREYVFCSGLDGIYQRFAANRAKITQPIAVEPYNMREFWVTDLDNNELIFGECTLTPQAQA